MTEAPRVHLFAGDPRRAAFLGNSLEASGFSVEIARDAQSVRRNIGAHPAGGRGAIVLCAPLADATDIGAVVADLRRLAPLLPVVVVETADAEAALPAICLAAGADAYVAAPAAPEVVVLQVRALLALQTRVRTLDGGRRPLSEPPPFTGLASSPGDFLLRDAATAPRIPVLPALAFDGPPSAPETARRPEEAEEEAPNSSLVTPVAPPVDPDVLALASNTVLPAPRLPEVEVEVELGELEETDLVEVAPPPPPLPRTSLAPSSRGNKESIPPDPAKLDDGW